MYYNQVWWIVEGTISINETGVIEVKAKNSLGRSVTARLGQYPEGIEQTEAGVKASKTIRNGQLIIIKNGVEFNVLGAELK